MKKSEKHNRRKFLSLGLLSGAALFAPIGKAESPQSVNDEETVMLLTSDGKLVAVKKSLVQGAKSGSKVSNQEILNWTNLPKSK